MFEISLNGVEPSNDSASQLKFTGKQDLTGSRSLILLVFAPGCQLSDYHMHEVSIRVHRFRVL